MLILEESIKSVRTTRKPVIYLLIVLPIMGLGGLLLIPELVKVRAIYHHTTVREMSDLSSVLLTLPAILLWGPISLLLANVVLVLIPPLRQIANTFATNEGRRSFLESQKELAKGTLYMALICLPLIAIGFFV